MNFKAKRYKDLNRIYRIFNVLLVSPLKDDFTISFELVFISWSALGFIFYITIRNLFENNAMNFININFEWMVLFTCLLFCSLLICYYNIIRHRKTLKKVYCKIFEFDSVIGVPKSNVDFLIYIYMLSEIFYCLGMMGFDFALNKDVKKMGVMAGTCWLYTLLTFQVKFLLFPLQPLDKRMKFLIRKLKRTGRSTDEDLSVLSDCYYNLVDCSKLVDKINGVPMVAYMLCFFTQMVVSSYAIFKCLYVALFENEPFLIITYGIILHTGVYMANLYYIVRQTCLLSDRAQEFNNRIYKLMIKDESYKLCQNNKLKLHISTKRDIVFTAWGFFDLDYSLIHSLIAAAATYIVILIQLLPSASQKANASAPNDFNDTTTANSTD